MRRSEDVWKVGGNLAWRAVRAGATLLLPLLLCFAVKGAVSAKGKAYVAVFYRSFEDEEDPETANVRAALNEALEDAGIAYREYDGEDDPLIQLAQIVQEKDAMLLIVNPAEQSFGDAREKAEEKAGEETEKNTVADTGADATADIIVQTDGRPLIFFDCEISEETVDGAEELCVLVNAAEPGAKTSAEETERRAAVEETEQETSGSGKMRVGQRVGQETSKSERESAAEEESETEMPGSENGDGLPKKNIQGMADAIALIAGNYMTGAGYFEGIEEDWVTDGWRVDIPWLLSK